MKEQQCMGERYIGCGISDGELVLRGTPGNALGAYLNGASITLYGNAQDATGDTMNEGSIVIYGNAGDALGYAMRGGQIYVKDNVGYRAGIHMKAYKEKLPVLVVGGKCGSFLGEYQAGGVIIVLGLGCDGMPPVGCFCGTGMHGGKIYLRCDELPWDLPDQVSAEKATPDELESAKEYIAKYCEYFGEDIDNILSANFFVLSPNTQNPYKRLYVQN